MRLGLIDRRAVNRRAAEVLSGLGLRLDPRRPVKGLRVAEQQMVEVAKALSLDARVLIMDEPTAALAEHEIRELFAAIRGLKAKGVSVVYISHRMEELFEIGDRVTVLRDGRSVGTFDVRETDKFELIRLMVNRDLTELFPKERAERGGEVLRVENLSTRGGLRDVSLSLHKGEVLGIAGLLGAGRTELARAIFGLDKIESGTVRIKGVARRIGSPRAAINAGLGFLTEDRKAQGLVLPLSVKDNLCLPSVDKFTSFGVVDAKRERREAERYVKELRIRTPGLDQKVVYLSGGNQQKVVLSQVALLGGRGLHLRRADARRGRGREGRDLSTDEPARRRGRRHHHDLFGAARDSGDERPHPRHARGNGRVRVQLAKRRHRKRYWNARWGNRTAVRTSSRTTRASSARCRDWWACAPCCGS